jgi:serine phosphatase RsbU (regulator of sigma subunit)
MLVQYVSAGHPPGYLFNISGSVKAILDRSSLPLGLEPETQFLVSDPLLLAPGDVLFLMTDGIIEAVSPENEQFGIPRALELVSRNRGKCARDMIEAIRDAATAFGDGQEHLDDLTAVVLKVEYVACGLNASCEPVLDDARESASAIGSAPCQTASATK